VSSEKDDEKNWARAAGDLRIEVVIANLTSHIEVRPIISVLDGKCRFSKPRRRKSLPGEMTPVNQKAASMACSSG